MPAGTFISRPGMARDMAGHFCPRCKTLLPPDRSRCPHCKEPSGQTAVRERGPVLDPSAPGLFPYTPRDGQITIVNTIREALASGRHLVMESGTGTGKTICALSGALEHAFERKKKVLYLTRTISQSDQVMKELRNISRKRPVFGLPVLGRGKSCLLMRSFGEGDAISPGAMSRMCEDMKRRAGKREKGGCPYYANLLASDDSMFLGYARRDNPTAEEFDVFCQGTGSCPYEARKLIMSEADVLVLPYIHMLSSDIRKSLFERLQLSADDFVVVVDEAHNLIDAARDEESFSLWVSELDGVEAEAKQYGRAWLAKGVDVNRLTSTLRDIIQDAANSQCEGVLEARLGRRFLEGRIREELGLSDEELDMLTSNLRNLGETILEKRVKDGDNPMSATLKLATTLEDWFRASDARFLKTVSASGGGGLIASCLEPKTTLEFLRQCSGVVHMSGTLQPLQQYVDVLDLPRDTVQRIFPSPFPPENRLVLYADDVNPGMREMRADPTMKKRICDRIVGLCNSTTRNTMVFFRSYEMLKSMRPVLEREIPRNLFWEESRSRDLAEAVQRFKTGRNGVFFTVMGGKVAEGLDFPGEELSLAIIVGLPYPPPSLVSEELKARFDKKYGFGKGWDYTSLAPALRKTQQAIGRLIRMETDRGAAVILDSRASRYEQQLGATRTRDPVAEVRRFFAHERG
jgi:DNA excision repair protein ERCC-2